MTARRSVWRRIGRWVARGVAALGLLVVLAVGALHTPWAKAWLRGKLEAKLAASFAGGASVGALDYGFLFSHVELDDVVIRDRAGGVAIRVATIAAVPDRGSVLHGAPVIEDLVITGLALTASEGSDGRSSLAGLLVASDRPPPASIAVTGFAITGAATLIRADGTRVTASDLVVRGALAARPIAGELDVTLGPVATTIAIAHPGDPARALDVRLGAITLARRGRIADVTAAGLVLGPLSIAAVRGHAELSGAVDAVQSLALDRLRVDHAGLRALVGRALVVDDVTGDVSLAGPLRAIAVHAGVAVRGSMAKLDGTLDVSEPKRPRYDLALAATGRSEDLIVDPPALIPPIATTLKLAVNGAGITANDLVATATLDAETTTVGRIGSVGPIVLDALHAKATADHEGVTLAQLSAHGLGVDVAATGTLARDRRLEGRITVAGEPDQTVAALRVAGVELPRALPHLPHVALAISARGALDGKLAVALEPATLALAGGSIAVAGAVGLEHRAVVDADARLALRGLDLAAIARLAGRPAKLRGTLDATLTAHHTPAAQRADYDVTLALPAVTVHATGHANDTELTTAAKVVRNGSALGDVTARLPIDRRGLVPERGWHVTLAVPRHALDDLIELLPPGVRAQLPQPGTIELAAELAGTPAAPRGTLDVTLAGARHAHVHATIAPGLAGTPTGAPGPASITPTGAPGLVITTTGELGTDAIAATLAGRVAIASPFVGRALVLHPAIAIDETVSLADRPIADLPLPAQLAALGGRIAGSLHVTGTVPALALAGQLDWRGYRTADGGTGALALALAGTPDKLTATLRDGPATIVAAIDRTGDQLAIDARAHADDTPLLPLLPALWPPLPAIDAGRLRWDMHAALAIHRGDAGLVLDGMAIDGSLAVRGAAFALPNTTRRWRDISLVIEGDPHGLRLTSLELHEHDPQVADRAVRISGLLALDRARPTHVALALETDAWLLLGLTSPVFSDAPTATLDLRARLDGDLTAAIPALDLTVDRLALHNPDRADRAHQPERASVSGDIIFVDASTPAGKLPVPAPPATPHGLPSLDVHVHLPHLVRIGRAPLDIAGTGEVDVTVRPDGVVATGELVARAGSLRAVGVQHDLVGGRITVSREHPVGWLDLEFEHPLPAYAARALADPAAAEHLTLHGTPAKPLPELWGAANAALPEVLAMYNAGRSLYAPRPDLPASSIAQVPRGDQVNILAYVSLVLPHLMVLDRISAWSDPSEPRGGYGRIRNLEADRYTGGKRNRVRAVGRPTTPGRSTAELQLDHLLLDDARRSLGIGLRAGDRLGGGLGLVFEWSSSPPASASASPPANASGRATRP